MNNNSDIESPISSYNPELLSNDNTNDNTNVNINRTSTISNDSDTSDSSLVNFSQINEYETGYLLREPENSNYTHNTKKKNNDSQIEDTLNTVLCEGRTENNHIGFQGNQEYQLTQFTPNENQSIQSNHLNDIDECSICLDLLIGEICVLQCQHLYHFDCISKWINKKNTVAIECPLCRRNTEIVNVYWKESITTSNTCPLESDGTNMSHGDLQGAPIESSGKTTKSHFSNPILKDNDFDYQNRMQYLNTFLINNQERYMREYGTIQEVGRNDVNDGRSRRRRRRRRLPTIPMQNLHPDEGRNMNDENLESNSSWTNKYFNCCIIL